MPLQRSPTPTTSGAPTTSVNAGNGLPITYDSDTPSDRSVSTRHGSLRRKRIREQGDDFNELRTEMKGLFTSLSEVVEQRFNEIKQQNTDLSISLQFMSDKYDAVLEKLQNLEKDRLNDKNLISVLEDKVEAMERKIKSTGLEIRNVPKAFQDEKRSETKEELSALVKTLATTVNLNLQDSDIKDVYRVNTNKQPVHPIIVELNSVIKKDKIMQAVKNFNKRKAMSEKLNTIHLKVSGPVRPVFVSETLTFKAQKLFYLSRDFARDNGYSYCWTSRGRVYLRKAEGQPLLRIESEADLTKFKNSNK